MRHNIAWSVVGQPGAEHDRAKELLDELRASNPPTMSETAIVTVIRRHIAAGDDPAGPELLAEILAEEIDDRA